jgi:hypothetical protein
MLHSRRTEEIMEYLASSSQMEKGRNLERCKDVKRQVVSIVDTIFESLKS